MLFPELPNDGRTYDVCVIGSGPVGITVALECESAGLTVLLLEAGQMQSQAKVDGMYEAEIVDPSHHAPLDLVTRSGFGGTSAVWGGRCVPFDDVDFEKRSFVPHSGWPISHQEVKRWYRKASYYLDCGTGEFEQPIALWGRGEDILFDTTERLSKHPRTARRFKHELKTSRRTTVALNCPISSLELDADGRSVRLARLAGQRLEKKQPIADVFVLACGGLQSTGILLDLQRTRPQYFDNDCGPLGRFYMGHLTGRIANIVLSNPSDVEYFDYICDPSGYWARRRFTFSAATQTEHEFLNTAFWLGSPVLSDPSHGSATASALYLTLKLILHENSRILSSHRNGETFGQDHLSNVLGNLPEIFKTFPQLMKQYLSRDDLRPLFIRNARGKYALHYHSEQIPNYSSRVRLIDNRDSDRVVSVDFRFSEDDARSVVRAHQILDEALRRCGKGYIEYEQMPEQRIPCVMAQALDGYHQIGSTRMSESDRLGVVDRNCRVHGLNNLYVAGSSVFNTSGQANPTFFAVALAARLADHLQKRSASRSVIAKNSPRPI